MLPDASGRGVRNCHAIIISGITNRDSSAEPVHYYLISLAQLFWEIQGVRPGAKGQARVQGES